MAFRGKEVSTVFYMDSMNDTNPAVAKQLMPANIHDIVSVLGKSTPHPLHERKLSKYSLFPVKLA